MAKSAQKSGTAKTQAADPPLGDAVRDSAQQIWQAGLGAFHRAQAEGSKAFEALVNEGVAMQRKTQSAAQAKLAEASSRASELAAEVSSKASGQWGKLESIFEDRVARAMHKLGMPTAQDLHALAARLDELSRAVQALSAKTGRSAPAKKVAAKKVAIKRRSPPRATGSGRA